MTHIYNTLLKYNIEAKKRRGKAKSPRSQFYSKLMGLLAGKKGDAVSQAFVSKNIKSFGSQWLDISKKLLLEATSEENRQSMEQKINNAFKKVL